MAPSSIGQGGVRREQRGITHMSRSAFTMALVAALGFAIGLLAYTGPSWLAIPVVILFGATASGWNDVFLAEVMREVRPAAVGFATSGSPMFTYFGVMIGPPLLGVAAALVGFQGAYALAAVLALAGAYLAWPVEGFKSA